MCKNYEVLNQFIGRKVEVFFHSLTLPYSATYRYNSFTWKVCEEDLCLGDSEESDNKTFINTNEIKSIKNLTEDIYTTVLDLCTGDFMVSICCVEEKVKLHSCNHCGKEIEFNEYWLSGSYGNIRLCEDCAYPLYPDMEVYLGLGGDMCE